MKYGGAGAGSRTMLDAMIPAATHLQAGGHILPDVVGASLHGFVLLWSGFGFSACFFSAAFLFWDSNLRLPRACGPLAGCHNF
jgi:hypothetical protein